MIPISDDVIHKALSKLDIHDKFLAAIEYGVIDEVKKLIEEDKVDIHESNERALELAIYYDHNDMVKYLLEKGADPNIGGGRLMRHPIDRNNLEQITMLLDYGFKLNADGWDHSEMLSIALRDGKDEEIIDLFLKHGAKVSNFDKLKKSYPKYTEIFNKYQP